MRLWEALADLCFTPAWLSPSRSQRRRRCPIYHEWRERLAPTPSSEFFRGGLWVCWPTCAPKRISSTPNGWERASLWSIRV